MGKDAETLALLMGSLGDKFTHIDVKECSCHLVVRLFFLSLSIIPGTLLALGRLWSLPSRRLGYGWGAITNQLTKFYYR